MSTLLFPSLPPKWIEPVDYEPSKRKSRSISGCSALLDQLKSYRPDYIPTKTALQKEAESRKAARAKHEQSLKAKLQLWKERNDPQMVGDPSCTLFVARLAYEIDDQRLQQELSPFGLITQVRVVKTAENKPRGYAFVVFSSPAGVRAALKGANGMLLAGRRILLDYERGRSSSRFLPRRLGGGIGGRVSAAEKAAAAAEAEKNRLAKRTGDYNNRSRPAPYNNRNNNNNNNARYQNYSGGYKRSNEYRSAPPRSDDLQARLPSSETSSGSHTKRPQNNEEDTSSERRKLRRY